LLTRWTIRLALLAYVGRFVVEPPRTAESPSSRNLARWLWTIACVLLWIHVVCAFEAYHHRSHALAYEHTARQTGALTGWNGGGGIYLNYLLMLLWAGGCACYACWRISPLMILPRCSG
jgi:hypothetical protein